MTLTLTLTPDPNPDPDPDPNPNPNPNPSPNQASSAMPLAAASLGVLTFNVCGNMIITAPLSAMDTVRLLWPSSSALA